MKPILTVTVLLFLFSCTPDTRQLEGQVEAYVPVYASSADISQIAIEAPKPIANAGKIYAYGNYIFQNDVNTGIHIVDNSNRTSPQKISFIKLPLSTEIAVKGNYLYTNNYRDIVVFDITNPANPVFVKRVADVFPPANQKYPPFTRAYFECPDETNGIVVRWELKRIDAPKCRRP